MSKMILEIGVEELPAIPLISELPNIKAKIAKILEKYRLDCEFSFFYTPRRLVITSNSFPASQKAQKISLFGPPLSVAFKDGKLSAAGSGFLKKCGLDSIKNQTTKLKSESGEEFSLPFEIKISKKDEKECLFFEKEAQCLASSELLGDICRDFLDSLSFGKTMRWGDLDFNFIRPVRWICALFDGQEVRFSAYGVEARAITYVHRNIDFSGINVPGHTEYFRILDSGNVILDQNVRKARILEQIENIEQENAVRVEIDPDLLDEVVAITEFPTALFGSFEQRFLELPQEVIITSMKVNQRYFAVFKDKKITNGFVVVANALANDFSEIVAGNEKVLRARLYDALFFYRNDLKNGLNPAPLANVAFMDKLGSMLDKVKREEKIAAILGEIFSSQLSAEISNPSLKDELLAQAAHLAKADLLSEMVYEFTELQGIMGSYYAKAAGLSEKIALAIKEQYLPNSEDGALPSSLFSAIIALCSKLDSMCALFSIGKIPSGSRDPFALRRAAVGVIKIALEFNLHFDLSIILNKLAPLYKAFDLGLLENFILERLEGILEVNPSILRAVLATNEKDLLEISLKAQALQNALKAANSETLGQLFKRIGNITKEVELNSALLIKKEFLLASEEIELYENFEKIVRDFGIVDSIKSSAKSIESSKKDSIDYEKLLNALLGLENNLARFFDKVLVNAPEAHFRDNRKNLLARIYKAFLSVADIKEITL